MNCVIAGMLAITHRLVSFLADGSVPNVPPPAMLGNLDSSSQALAYAASGRNLWQSHPGALEWLQQTAHGCLWQRLLDVDSPEDLPTSFPQELLTEEKLLASLEHISETDLVLAMDLQGDRLLHMVCRKHQAQWSCPPHSVAAG